MKVIRNPDLFLRHTFFKDCAPVRMLPLTVDWKKPERTSIFPEQKNSVSQLKIYTNWSLMSA